MKQPLSGKLYQPPARSLANVGHHKGASSLVRNLHKKRLQCPDPRGGVKREPEQA